MKSASKSAVTPQRGRFEEQATLEGLDFAASPKLPAAQVLDLAALAARRRIGDPLRPGRNCLTLRMPFIGAVELSSLVGPDVGTQAFSAFAVDVDRGEFAAVDLVLLRCR
jgi:hypothetical protein